jgi:hypothetical protein
VSRRTTTLLIGLALLLLVAVPVLAAEPSTAPGRDKDKDKTPKAPITLNGTIERSAADASGKSDYTISDGGKTYTLEAGPKWFFEKGAYPLDPYVGRNVKVEGEIADGSTDVEVTAIDDTALRDPGKPPWAGGWKVVGEKHPGWSQEKADRFKAKFGDCFPPGQCRDESKGPDHDKGAPEGSEAPEGD